MSITTEIQRLRTNVNNIRQNTSDILNAIANKGVTIPAGSTLDDCAGLISHIGTGGIDINEYFEACPVYWNTEYNQAFYFPTGTISNKNLRIKGTFYSPNGPLRGRLFSLDTNTGYQNKTVCVQYQNSSQFLLYNGANVIYPTPPDLNGVYEIDIFQDKFKINGVDYLGGYSQNDNLNYIYVLPGRIGNYAYSEQNKSALMELKLINTDTDNVICHFIGAKRKSDNRPYVIDLKNATSQFNQSGFLSIYPNPI